MKKLLLLTLLIFSVSSFASDRKMYLDVKAGYKRLTGINNYGAGVDFGYKFTDIIGAEVYSDYTTGSDLSVSTYGAKLAIFPVEYLYIKAGAGFARTTVDIFNISASSTDLALEGNVGVALPVSDLISIVVDGSYSRILADTGVNMFGGMAGVQFKF